MGIRPVTALSSRISTLVPRPTLSRFSNYCILTKPENQRDYKTIGARSFLRSTTRVPFVSPSTFARFARHSSDSSVPSQPPMAELFKLDIPRCSTHGPGSIVVTSPAEKVYLLTFSNPPDNRLAATFIQAFLFALDIIEHRYPVGVVISTSAIPKFYSNGLDLEHVMATPGFHDDSLYKLERRLSTYPMPTVALLNGHAFAGGLIVAMHHDYRIMNPSKGYCCMSMTSIIEDCLNRCTD